MDYRVILSVFLVVLAVQAAPPIFSAVPQKEVSDGPQLLNDEDTKVLLLATQQVTQHNKVNPGENTYAVLEELVDSAETAAGILTNLMNKVHAHEEKSHNAIEYLRSSDPDTTEACVRDVFGTPTRTSIVYCGVKYFSQVSIGLWEMKNTIKPLKETLQKIRADVGTCQQTSGLSDKFICHAQALRDAWETSENVRARLVHHFTVIRSLVFEINKCIKSNHQVQAHFVNKVAECAQASK